MASMRQRRARKCREIPILFPQFAATMSHRRHRPRSPLHLKSTWRLGRRYDAGEGGCRRVVLLSAIVAGRIRIAKARGSACRSLVAFRILVPALTPLPEGPGSVARRAGTPFQTRRGLPATLGGQVEPQLKLGCSSYVRAYKRWLGCPCPVPLSHARWTGRPVKTFRTG